MTRLLAGKEDPGPTALRAWSRTIAGRRCCVRGGAAHCVPTALSHDERPEKSGDVALFDERAKASDLEDGHMKKVSLGGRPILDHVTGLESAAPAQTKCAGSETRRSATGKRSGEGSPSQMRRTAVSTREPGETVGTVEARRPGRTSDARPVVNGFASVSALATAVRTVCAGSRFPPSARRINAASAQTRR